MLQPPSVPSYSVYIFPQCFWMQFRGVNGHDASPSACFMHQCVLPHDNQKQQSGFKMTQCMLKLLSNWEKTRFFGSGHCSSQGSSYKRIECAAHTSFVYTLELLSVLLFVAY